MQTFDTFPPPRRATGYPPISSVPSQVPPPRTYESELPSDTPIYDALYSEFRRLFRALPGDRTGEEDLRFNGFGSGGYASYGGYGNADRYGYSASVASTGVYTPWQRVTSYAEDPAAQGAGRHRGYLSLPPGRSGRSS